MNKIFYQYLFITLPNRRHTSYLYLCICIALLAVSCASRQSTPNNLSKHIELGSSQLAVEVADTPQKQEQGLSGRVGLAPNSAMVFDFTHTTNKHPHFWMKDMRFDLDILWVQNNQVVAINQYVPKPQSHANSLPTYFTTKAIDYVVELPAGFCKEHNIHIGTLFRFIN